MSDRLSLRLRDAARLLGVSERTLWGWAKQGRVPHAYVGSGRRRVLLFPADLLRDWLRKHAEAQGKEAEGLKP